MVKRSPARDTSRSGPAPSAAASDNHSSINHGYNGIVKSSTISEPQPILFSQTPLLLSPTDLPPSIALAVGEPVPETGSDDLVSLRRGMKAVDGGEGD